MKLVNYQEKYTDMHGQQNIKIVSVRVCVFVVLCLSNIVSFITLLFV